MAFIVDNYLFRDMREVRNYFSSNYFADIVNNKYTAHDILEMDEDEISEEIFGEFFEKELQKWEYDHVSNISYFYQREE